MHVGRVCHGRQCVYCKLDTPQMAASTYVESCIWHVVRNQVCACVCTTMRSTVCSVSVCAYTHDLHMYVCEYIYTHTYIHICTHTYMYVNDCI
jgi:hypothetical protein